MRLFRLFLTIGLCLVWLAFPGAVSHSAMAAGPSTRNVSDGPASRSVATITVRARIDGSDVLTLKKDEATWEHRTYAVPSDVSVNGIKWDVANVSKMRNAGNTKYLPFDVDFQSCRVISQSGRDIVAIEPTKGGLRIIFEDSPAGADDYSITVQFDSEQLQAESGKGSATQPSSNPIEVARLRAENRELRKLLESSQSELVANRKLIAQLKSSPAQRQATASGDSKAASDKSILDVSGKGSKTTQKFAVDGDWDLNWTYDCREAMAGVGGQGNFQVYIYNGDGSICIDNGLVNQMGKNDSGVEHYHNGGTFYLVVNSEGSWKVNVTTPKK